MGGVRRASDFVTGEAGCGPGVVICGEECDLVLVMGVSPVLWRVGLGVALVMVIVWRGLDVVMIRIGCSLDLTMSGVRRGSGGVMG